MSIVTTYMHIRSQSRIYTYYTYSVLPLQYANKIVKSFNIVVSIRPELWIKVIQTINVYEQIIKNLYFLSNILKESAVNELLRIIFQSKLINGQRIKVRRYTTL